MGEVGVGVLGCNILLFLGVCFGLCAAILVEFVSGRICEEYDADEEETPGGRILLVDLSPGVLRCNFLAIGCLARSGFTRSKF